jgi:hypothetical protein
VVVVEVTRQEEGTCGPPITWEKVISFRVLGYEGSFSFNFDLIVFESNDIKRAISKDNSSVSPLDRTLGYDVSVKTPAYRRTLSSMRV